MDLHRKDPAVTRAMALALMRQALELLDATEEQMAAAQLQQSVDTLLRRRPDTAVEAPA
jgi:hypothetical protein